MTDQVISKRLKEARIERGLSQKELGIQAGFDEFVASARMNQYERGVHSPNLTTLTRIAKVLETDAAYFYCADESLARLIKLYSRADKVIRQKLLATLEKS